VSGDTEGARITELFVEHGGRLYGYAYRRTLSSEEAKDVVADTYLIALRHIDRVPEPALPWLFTVARRLLANRSRAAANRERTAARLGAREDADPDPFEESSSHERLRQAFRSLSEDDQETLMLIEWDGLSNKEAALVVGCSTPAFAVRLHRTRRRLARELQRDPGASVSSGPEAPR